MVAPLRFWFDFASPYAWFALRPLRDLAARHGRAIEWRPVILWAVFKAQGIADPLGSPARRAYLLADMVRSAAFLGVPFRLPERFGTSSHRLARLYHAVVADRPDLAADFVEQALAAVFVDGADVAVPEAMTTLLALCGLDAAAATAAIDATAGRAGLEGAVADAVADGVCGSPFVLVDGEGFFGADRLPQIAWRLETAAARREAATSGGTAASEEGETP